MTTTTTLRATSTRHRLTDESLFDETILRDGLNQHLEIMNKIEMNIGLNNNPYTAHDIVTRFVSAYTSVKHNIQVGEWDGADEPTLVMEFYSESSLENMRAMIQGLVYVLTQDAIAFRFNGDGELVFSSHYTGERYEFDENYFLTI